MRQRGGGKSGRAACVLPSVRRARTVAWPHYPQHESCTHTPHDDHGVIHTHTHIHSLAQAPPRRWPRARSPQRTGSLCAHKEPPPLFFVVAGAWLQRRRGPDQPPTPVGPERECFLSPPCPTLPAPLATRVNPAPWPRGQDGASTLPGGVGGFAVKRALPPLRSVGGLFVCCAARPPAHTRALSDLRTERACAPRGPTHHLTPLNLHHP